MLSKLAEDDELEQALYHTNLRVNLAGELFVRDIELPRTLRKAQDESGEATFLELPFIEAINYFAEREVMSPEEFAELEDTERFRAFAMARQMSDALTDQARDRIFRAMDPGGPGLDEFIRGMQRDEASLGFTPNDPWYLETVYRTSTATSYNAGRQRAQTDADVVESTGYWRYSTAGGPAARQWAEAGALGEGPNNVRPSHAILQDKVWTIGDPQAEAVYPPNGFNCRCVMVIEDEEDVDPVALKREVDIDSAIHAGFRGSPIGTIEQEAA